MAASAVMESPSSSTIKHHPFVYGKSPMVPFMYPSRPSLTFGQVNPNGGSMPPHFMRPCAWSYPFHHEVSRSAQCFHAFGNDDVGDIASKRHVLMQSCRRPYHRERVPLHGSDVKENTSLATTGEPVLRGSSHGGKGLPEKLHGAFTCLPRNLSSMVSVMAATEARKTRKQLMKSKQSQGRPAETHG